MRRFGQVIRVRPDRIDEYEQLHAATWPGVLGAILFAISAFCVYATVLLVAHFRDLESGFPAGPGFVQGVKGFGLVLFPVFALITAAAGWALAGDQVRGLWHRIRGHGSSGDH